MSIITPTNELDELAEQFKSWRKRYPRKYIPRRYWTRAAQLTEQYPIKTVAKRVGIDASSLRRKVKKKYPATQSGLAKANDSQFIEVPTQTARHILSFDQTVTMRVRNPKGLQIDLSFTSNIGELFPLVKDLVKEG